MSWLSDAYDDVTGKTAEDKARKANKKNLKKNLKELKALLPMLEEYFAQSRAELIGGYGRARKVMGGYLEEGSSKFDQALQEVQSGYDQASSLVDKSFEAQAGAAQESALAAQSQSLAAAQQGMLSRGLANTSVGTSMARGIAGDTARALGQTMAGIGAQKAAMQSGLATGRGQASADVLQGQAGLLQSSAGMLGGLELQRGSELSTLLQQLASQKLHVGGMRSTVRSGVQHVAGPSPLMQGAQIASLFVRR